MAALIEVGFFFAVETTAVRFHLDCSGFLCFLCFLCLRLFYILCAFRSLSIRSHSLSIRSYSLFFCLINNRLSRILCWSDLLLSLNWLSFVLDRFSFVLGRLSFVLDRLSFDCLRFVLGRLDLTLLMLLVLWQILKARVSVPSLPFANSI